jgi:hypothetical protein
LELRLAPGAARQKSDSHGVASVVSDSRSRIL